jgi:transcriptional regulator with GAF, ATPase, and Fis domain
MAWVCLKEGRPYSEVTNEVQKHLFKRILTETQGDLDQAAMRLGMKKDDLSYIVESRYPELTDKIARHLPAVLLLVAGVF